MVIIAIKMEMQRQMYMNEVCIADTAPALHSSHYESKTNVAPNDYAKRIALVHATTHGE